MTDIKESLKFIANDRNGLKVITNINEGVMRHNRRNPKPRNHNKIKKDYLAKKRLEKEATKQLQRRKPILK